MVIQRASGSGLVCLLLVAAILTCSVPFTASPATLTAIFFSDAQGNPIFNIHRAMNTVFVTVIDPDENHSSTIADKITDHMTVTLLRDDNSIKTVSVNLSESGPNTETFISDPITLGKGKMLEISEFGSQHLKAEYIDPNDAFDTATTTMKVWTCMHNVGAVVILAKGRIIFKGFSCLGPVSRIQVSVYDMTGKLVFRVSKTDTIIQWDERGTQGAPLVNGVYSYIVVVHSGPEGRTFNTQRGKLIILN